MIQVTVKSKAGAIREMEITGHGGGMKGSDVVCSAVSAVAQTALAGLLHYSAEQVQWKKENGLLAIRVTGLIQPERGPLIDAILTTAYIGLREIARQYPERVVVNLLQSP